MKIGFIGLGRMGSRMVIKLLEGDHEVVVWNRSSSKVEELKSKFKIQPVLDRVETRSGNLKVASSVKDLVNQLDLPRVIWSMLPAGEATEEILDEVEKYVESGDVIIDGGNAFFEDTERRYRHFRKKFVKFLGIGVSGGVIAAREGYPLMAGGDQSAYDHIKPILDSLSKPNGGHEYFGQGGAGHFVKMVHNGIEYGIMQSVGEGFGLLQKSPYNLDLLKVAKLYQKGTLVSGFMMQRTIDALEKDPKLSQIEGYIEESGEGRWTVEQAKREKVSVPIIEESLMYRAKSRQDSKVSSTFAAKLVAALRQAFGGHEVKKK
ncbi:6-phosphogluconate dehydrogenase (decarboxylating) [Candidatus Curtissbacteria bacterium RIFCSPHIGHO2_12_41_11]|uniref:6-phosphogluconate dehydrogenase (Decarboxylating) n=3 Tax=Candidatus Curtissiibacteriota TaxID=1752717 RepID=A0A1F5HUJ4_9BACT|nr:MAG: 6-phosphogluconate dehydrogenase, decarboxylating [Candidatus Curtissbacteria bacterium GW2011_GWA2_41_24]OGD88816.1 MAG: 6-phosphogluconate dehydrogenase (decarboxylating) [Candidatus Curtissbacteria bacterium RIFCSPHIGHO2_02_39_8]OGD98985.1 MAG: 6-phosphogluconate dehydrogenase (decarboxylating) [Candidatus Curtissbacteria bacterium RIFCSPHIGHO2_12_41_11]OGE07852.1 MAG: 6-phosphogluconate dehydrogenase (decarboxylating) [Candidatus Curtissbacteria bacterium RIFCSPLOWO2_02_41_11]